MNGDAPQHRLAGGAHRAWTTTTEAFAAVAVTLGSATRAVVGAAGHARAAVVDRLGRRGPVVVVVTMLHLSVVVVAVGAVAPTASETTALGGDGAEDAGETAPTPPGSNAADGDTTGSSPPDDLSASRGMPYEQYAASPHEMLDRLPSLAELYALLPPSGLTDDVEAQQAHIAELEEAVDVTVDGFEDLEIDTTRREAFADLSGYQQRIQPRMFVVHWTAMGYEDVDHFVDSLRPLRVQFFMDRDGEVHDLFEADHHKPAHARGANDFSQGVEIETGDLGEAGTPLLQYTAEQIEQTVYLAVEFLRRNDLPIDETTVVGHYAADLIFSNPVYDPHEGAFAEPRVRKLDPPQELMEVIVDEATDLAAALDADRETG